ncbi:MAG: hypothetical protein H0U27_04610, partial [Nitrosopumilus sp.]|nr:hypothetical protein [Nitrosopumilus sp.]
VISLGDNEITEVSEGLIRSFPELENLFLRKNPLNKETIATLNKLHAPFKLDISYDD